MAAIERQLTVPLDRERVGGLRGVWHRCDLGGARSGARENRLGDDRVTSSYLRRRIAIRQVPIRSSWPGRDPLQIGRQADGRQFVNERTTSNRSRLTSSWSSSKSRSQT